MAKLSETELSRLDEDGFVVLPEFLSGSELDAAVDAIEQQFPAARDYHADPRRYAWVTESQFSGNTVFPWRSFDLNRLTVADDLVAVAEQALGTTDLLMYKGELWAKYAGAIDYEQALHRDFGNHTLLVPRADQRWRQLTTFLFLNDVEPGTGAPAVVARRHSEHLSMGVDRLPLRHELEEVEVQACGPAGTLVLYFTDVFHRATNLTEPNSARFMVLVDFKRSDMAWGGRHAWPHHALKPAMAEFIERISPRQRELLGIPPVGHPYWNRQTIDDVAIRYPAMDLAPYEAALAASVPGHG